MGAAKTWFAGTAARDGLLGWSHTGSVGGSAETGHMAVTVWSKRPAGPSVETTVTPVTAVATAVTNSFLISGDMVMEVSIDQRPSSVKEILSTIYIVLCDAPQGARGESRVGRTELTRKGERHG
mgnify:CR=1 FL=1